MNKLKLLLYIFFWPINQITWFFQGISLNRITAYGFLFINNSGKIYLKDNIIINSNKFANMIGGDFRSSITVSKGGHLFIGSNVQISNSTIYCRDKIIIEDFVMVGGGCKIWDTDFHPIDIAQRKINPNYNYKSFPIHIKKYAFIGADSIILKGVTIGENCVIGAGSVVRKDIPDNQIWAGNPAVYIKDVK